MIQNGRLPAEHSTYVARIAHRSLVARQFGGCPVTNKTSWLLLEHSAGSTWWSSFVAHSVTHAHQNNHTKPHNDARPLDTFNEARTKRLTRALMVTSFTHCTSADEDDDNNDTDYERNGDNTAHTP